MGFYNRFQQSALPRLRLEPRPSLGELFLLRGLTIAGSTVSILVLVYWPTIVQTTGEWLYAIFLNILVWLSVGYIAQLHFRKTPRYARAIGHIHFVLDAIRDVLATLRVLALDPDKDPEKMEEIVTDQLSDILTAIATAFSIVTGHNCAVCVKEVRGDEVRTIARDIFSSATRRRIDVKKNIEGQKIDDATGAQSVIRQTINHGSYYLGNDLPRLYKKGLYKNPGQHGDKWMLPYSSTLMVPIRYVPKHQRTPRVTDEPDQTVIWGLLCIDAPSRKCFRNSIDPDLAMAFADALFSMFSQAALMSRIELNSPSE